VSDPDFRSMEFEQLYASVGDDLERVPWAGLAPHPRLIEWLEASRPEANGAPALVIGCGLGDDAEELARRGYVVTAFDFAPTAIGWCRKRFPSSAVDYRVADLFALPEDWKESFQLIVEINTIQSLPLGQRPGAIAAIARPLAPDGRLFVYCLARADDAPVEQRPWPVSRAELAAFDANGLRELELVDLIGVSGKPTFRAVYTR
jgi:SAM-dependent methyltransferase